MPIDAAERNLFIANTILFPMPPLRLGVASLILSASKFPDENSNSTIEAPTRSRRRSKPPTEDANGKPVNLLVFEENHPDWSIERRMLAEDVAALFIPETLPFNWDMDAWWNHGTWLAGKDLTANTNSIANQVQQRGTPVPDDTSRRTHAVLYVSENVRMVNIVRYGGCAGESHQYAPPVELMKLASCRITPGPNPVPLV